MTGHDVVIVGGGPAGLAAARRLAALGIDDVVVIEREQEAGGVPRHCGHPVFGWREFGRPMSGPAYARRLRAAVDPARLLTGATVTAIAPGGVVEISGQAGQRALRGRRVLLATGVRETPRAARLISGGRPWGVVTTGALQQFVYLTGRRPFDAAVVVGTELVSFSALLTLRHAGIAAVAMIEENARITARRPGDLVARLAFGAPVLTASRLVSIEGRERVTGVIVESRGVERRLACDGVVISGRFTPEAALLAGGAVARDPGTGGPAIDQHWRCSDAAYFAAGNLLHPVETAGVAYREGVAAAQAIAASLRGALPPATRLLDVVHAAPLKYVYPQRISVPGDPLSPLQFKARVERAVRGDLEVVVNGRSAWRRRAMLLPERRIDLPRTLIDPAALESVSVGIDSGARET